MINNLANIPLPAGFLLVIIGAIVAGATDAEWWAAFFIMLGISLLLFGAGKGQTIIYFALGALVVSLILLVVALSSESEWIREALDSQ